MIGLKFRPSVCNLVDIRGLPQVDFQILCFNPYPRPKSLKIIKHCGNGNQSLIITDNPCLPHICVQILGKHHKLVNDKFKLKADLGFNQKLKKQINQMIQFLFYTRMKKNWQDSVQQLLFARFIRVIGQYLTD